MIGLTNTATLSPERHCPNRGLARRALGESSVRSAMSIAKVRTARQAPLGAACRPTEPCEPAMPLLAELANDPLESCYKHAAPDGAIAAQAFE